MQNVQGSYQATWLPRMWCSNIRYYFMVIKELCLYSQILFQIIRYFPDLYNIYRFRDSYIAIYFDIPGYRFWPYIIIYHAYIYRYIISENLFITFTRKISYIFNLLCFCEHDNEMNLLVIQIFLCDCYFASQCAKVSLYS